MQHRDAGGAEGEVDQRMGGLGGKALSPIWLADPVAQLQPAILGVQPGASYALTLAGTGTFVGCAGLNAKGRGLELGYWIGEPYWKRGFATEAAHALVDLAFRTTGISVLHVSARVINPASRRVIHKCGFQYAGQGMMNSIVSGQVPIERYRLDRKTWESLRNWS